ncbi:transposase [Marinimicrobium locisalis]|uniref:transposase n=1 Tax=Marinimicrobium locisalis TaxID=546022 RepID=UPI0032214809
MPDIRFSRTPANANQLCQQDPETLEQFLSCNPQVSNGNTTMSGYFAYNTSSSSSLASQIVTQQFNSLPMTARQNLDQCVANYGEDVHAMAEFYERHLANFELPSPADVNGVAGVGVAAAQGRTTSFQNALIQYQQALIKLHRHNKVGRVAGAQKIQLRQEVTEAYELLNRHYSQEMRRIVPAQHRNRNRGTALSNVNLRSVVTNLKQSDKHLCTKVYCARGDTENRIKEQQLLFSGRISCHEWWPNQFSLLLSAMAYTLVERLRNLALAGTEWVSVQVGTIRLKLLKIGGVVIRNTRQVMLLLSSASKQSRTPGSLLMKYSG